MPSKQQSIILGGLVVTILSTSYLSYINMLCCLGVLTGSMVAVWHYTDTNEITIRSGEGAVMGILAALFGLVIASVLNFSLIKMGIRHDLAISQAILNFVGDSMPPEQYDAMVEQMEAEYTIGMMMKNMAFNAIPYVIFGAIGGLIGSKMFKKGGDEPADFEG